MWLVKCLLSFYKNMFCGENEWECETRKLLFRGDRGAAIHEMRKKNKIKRMLHIIMETY